MIRRILFLAALLFGLAAMGIAWIELPEVRQLTGPSIQVVQWSPIRGKELVTVGPGFPGWTKSTEISKHTLYAILVAEDARF